ncbi:FAD-dependent oxidoreductase [Candidatus Roseilinea sp. NK_OTU-006]|uniref:FAD-dependent oxidoreductase n=1 Tax=Candidatus Roseilinea sp. NK_OTU-006 TaxID=2704250 RepID=UPI00403E21EE
MPDGRPLNPGDGWVSRLCFEPRIGSAALQAMLALHIASGRLAILLNSTPQSAVVRDDRVVEVRLQTVASDASARAAMVAELAEVTIRARFFLDATELGDLLPLTGTEYVTGAESRADTGEPDAPPGARPGEVQSFTYCFAVEYCPGERHVIEKPLAMSTCAMHNRTPWCCANGTAARARSRCSRRVSPACRSGRVAGCSHRRCSTRTGTWPA